MINGFYRLPSPTKDMTRACGESMGKLVSGQVYDTEMEGAVQGTGVRGNPQKGSHMLLTFLFDGFGQFVTV